ncbi:MAG: 16S rRNA (cytidine(1402)-2'-O)-methyltransferase [Mariprofundaceae bacterium]
MDSQTNDKHGNGQLFIVATPIGNLADITYRAVETLKSVHLIAAEDTRVSRRLCSHYGIDTALISCHEHNEEKVAGQLLEHIRAGRDVALISDAGTPLINDPGYRLVSKLRRLGMKVTPIPGASSPIAALSASGLPSDRFTYEGFLARSGKTRKTQIETIARAHCTSIILESPHRLLKTLDELRTACGDARLACMAREMTKLHETFAYGTLVEVLKNLRTAPIKGEIVLLIGPDTAVHSVSDASICEAVALAAEQNLTPSALAKHIARQLNVPRSRVYALLLTEQQMQYKDAG